MHWSLGNVQRGIIGGAITGDGVAVVSAITGASPWNVALAAVAGSLFVVAGALIDPGSAPPKAAE